VSNHGRVTCTRRRTAIVARLKERADEHRRSVEDEHRAILRDVLLEGDQETPTLTFEAYLRQMPDVGTDGDFSRIEGSIRAAADSAGEHGTGAAGLIALVVKDGRLQVPRDRDGNLRLVMAPRVEAAEQEMVAAVKSEANVVLSPWNECERTRPPPLCST